MTAKANVNMYGDGGSGAVPQLLPSDEELADIEKQRRAEELELQKNKVKEKPDNKKPKDSDTDGGDVNDSLDDADDNADDEDADDGEGEEDDGEDGGEAGDESDDDEEEDEDDEATASSAPGARKIRRVALAADGGYNNVFSGFPGVGKSTVFNNADGLVVADSDSSTFDKKEFPDNYLMHIQETRPSVDVLLVSSHNVVRDELEERGIPFHLVYPTVDQKDEYMARYKQRGSPQPFLDLMDQNWEKFIGECAQQQGCTHVVLKPGQFLGDVIQDYL
jgi:hypothetical protein